MHRRRRELLRAGNAGNPVRRTVKTETGMAETGTEIVIMDIIVTAETGMADATAVIIITVGTVTAADVMGTATTVRAVLEIGAEGRRAMTPEEVRLHRWTA